MKLNFNPGFFTSSTGQLVVVGLLAVVAVGAVGWRKTHPATKPLVVSAEAKPISLPRIFTREGAKFVPPSSPTPGAIAATPASPKAPPVPEKPRVLPLGLFASAATQANAPAIAAPYGRLIPCETLLTLESNRLDTPVIGLVTEDVWHNGRLLVPAGAEVHGRAALDRTRERLAVQGSWNIIWRESGESREIQVTGLALDRAEGGEPEGSAGLRGDVLKTDDNRELKLFAATFLSTATAALQDTHSTAGLLGETALVASTARNAALAGTSAILREYAQQLRDAITRDGFYLRVPAGKPFYLYVTQPLSVPPSHED